jgi:tRNA-dihydrouridine synthase A
MLASGHRLSVMLRHIHGLYSGFPGARSWRRYLSEQGARAGADADVLRASLRVFARAA